MKTKILIIDDEMKYAYILEKFFLASDFEVALAFDGISGLEEFHKFNPDVICLDIMMPKMDGYEVAKRIREESNVPIIMMSALSDESDVLKGYSLKIDDYVTKPFRTPILIAKVKNLIERRKDVVESYKTEKNDCKEVSIGSIRLTSENMQCFINDECIKLTKTEYKLLEYLIMHKGQNCTREALYETFWNDSDIDSRIIDTYIKKLRKLVENAGCKIVTVFGIGYRLEEEKQS